VLLGIFARVSDRGGRMGMGMGRMGLGGWGDGRRMGWGGCGDFLLQQRGEEEAIITQLWFLVRKARRDAKFAWIDAGFRQLVDPTDRVGGSWCDIVNRAKKPAR